MLQLQHNVSAGNSILTKPAKKLVMHATTFSISETQIVRAFRIGSILIAIATDCKQPKSMEINYTAIIIIATMLNKFYIEHAHNNYYKEV